MKNTQEIFEVIDESGAVLRTAAREECHADPALLHRAVHCLVFNDAGELFLQKRALNKSIQPGKWDTSVGGHVAAGEEVVDALHRETKEELGFDLEKYDFLSEYVWRCPRESELIRTYQTFIHPGLKILCDPDEIIEGRFWNMDELDKTIALQPKIFTPNFLYEIKVYREKIAMDKMRLKTI